MGYTREEIETGQVRWTDITPTEFLSLDEKAAAELRTNGVATPFEKEFIRKDGTSVPILIGSALLQEPCDRQQEIIAFFIDLTERKQVEAAWQEGKQTLDAIMDYIPEGITIAEAPDVTIRQVSRYGQQLTGRPRDEIVGIPVTKHVEKWGLLRRDGTQPSGEELPLTRAVQQAEVVTDEEWILQRPDGSQISILCNAGPIRDRDGNTSGGVMAWRDITERKRFEETLRQLIECAKLKGTEFFNTLVRVLAEALNVRYAFVGEVYSKNQEQVRTLAMWVDGNWSENCEYELADTPCQNVTEQGLCFYHSQVTALFPHDPLLAQMGVDSYLGILLRASDGTTLGLLVVMHDRPIDEQLQPETLIQIFAGQVAAELERQQTEDSLRAAEERLRLALAAARMIVWDWDLQTNRVICSEKAEAVWGIQVGAADDFVAAVHPEDRAIVAQAAASAQQGEGIYSSEYRVVGPDGIVRWLHSRGRTHFNAAGQPQRIIGVSLDISAAKHREAERKRAEAEREQLLAREQAARAEAERANRIKDEFLAIVSHELRSPLNPILGWSMLLRTQNLDRAKTTQALSTIERNAKLQAELIEDLLDISRILRGKLSLNVCPVDLVPTIRAAMETVRLAAIAKSIQIDTMFEPDVGLVSGDPARLQQVVWNLLSNAIKFTPAGGRVEVKLSLVTSHSPFVEDGQITTDESQRNASCSKSAEPTAVALCRETRPPRCLPNALAPNDQELMTNNRGQMTEDEFAQITVSDTGKGIHPDFLPHVFDYFRQEDGATTRKFGGLGLGLAIVHHLVELHGGTVQAESPGEGQGATFTVRLPLMPTSPQISQDSIPSELALDLTDFQVLVVEDDADTRDFVAFLLEQAGARAIASASAGEALAALKRSKPDVLLSDIGMPEVDGYMLMRQVRALPPEQGGQIPAIALTAYAGEIDYQQAMSAGFQRHVAKPIEPQKLIEAIVSLVRQS
ncbi:PAS domain S-box protein [Pleurocapsales cyanobacterium LEGE 06147]|nr:PAS domain S-box protein [Pleurocapsales cyanobacterium LEGE 06147]